MNSEQRYILALSFIKGIGDNRVIELVKFFGSAEKVWNSSISDLIKPYGFGNKLVQEIGKQNYLDLADKELEFCEQHQIKVLSFFDDEYPFALKQCQDAPVILFTRGNINFNSLKKISIVGTRKMTNYGKAFIEELIDGLKDFDVTIVSGLAYGCDIYAHQMAIKNELPTWAVLAHHLDHIYPTKHKTIAEKMLHNGGWISEQPSFKTIMPQFFLQRNRIIAGLSDVTIMVESGSHGGSLVTAKFANEYNRDVFALPGKTTDSLSKGCNYLIKTHQAYLIENSADLIYHLNLNTNSKKPIQTSLFIDLNPEEENIINYIRQNGKVHIDNLALGLEVLTYELMPILLDLELKQVIQPLPGKYFDLYGA